MLHAFTKLPPFPLLYQNEVFGFYGAAGLRDGMMHVAAGYRDGITHFVAKFRDGMTHVAAKFRDGMKHIAAGLRDGMTHIAAALNGPRAAKNTRNSRHPPATWRATGGISSLPNPKREIPANTACPGTVPSGFGSS